MKRILATILLAMCCAPAFAQSCTPGGGVTCSPTLNLWLLPFGYANWNAATNANASTLDTFAATTNTAIAGKASATASTTVNSQTCALGGSCTVTVPVSTGVTGLGAGVVTFLATPSSANLGLAVTGATGSGPLVFATSPTLVTPNLGTPSAAVLTNATGLPLATGVTGSLTVPNGGTGAATLTGILKGNGTAAFTAAAGLDVNTLVAGLTGCGVAGNLYAPQSGGCAPPVGDTITSPGATLAVGGTAIATTLDVNLAHANTWSALQTFSGGVTVSSFATAGLVTTTALGVLGTSGKSLTGAGAAVPTGPTASVSGDVATFTGVAGQIADSGTLLTALAPLANPTFTGIPAAPTPASLINTTQIPTTAYLTTYYAPLANPVFTGTATIPTLKLSGTNTMSHIPRAYPAWHQASGTSITTGSPYGPFFWSGEGSTIERLTADFTGTTTCSVAPVLVVVTCTTVACAAPTTIATLTTGTAAGGYDSGVLSVAIPASLFFVAEFSAGTCSSRPAIDFAATVRTN